MHKPPAITILPQENSRFLSSKGPLEVKEAISLSGPAPKSWEKGFLTLRNESSSSPGHCLRVPVLRVIQFFLLSNLNPIRDHGSSFHSAWVPDSPPNFETKRCFLASCCTTSLVEEDACLQKARESFSIPRGQCHTGNLGSQLLSPCKDFYL